MIDGETYILPTFNHEISVKNDSDSALIILASEDDGIALCYDLQVPYQQHFIKTQIEDHCKYKVFASLLVAEKQYDRANWQEYTDTFNKHTSDRIGTVLRKVLFHSRMQMRNEGTSFRAEMDKMLDEYQKQLLTYMLLKKTTERGIKFYEQLGIEGKLMDLAKDVHQLHATLEKTTEDCSQAAVHVYEALYERKLKKVS